MGNYALLLNGEGSKNFFELGAWIALKELDIKIDAVSGGFFGVINAALIAGGDIDKCVAFWNKWVKDEVYKIRESVSKKYFEEWASLDKKAYKKAFTKYLTSRNPEVIKLQNILEEFIDEKEIRVSRIRLGLTSVNLSNLETESLMIDSIPKGKLILYMMVAICFQEDIEAEENKNNLLKELEPSFALLANNGYLKILSLDENASLFKVEGLEELKAVKTSKFLGLSEEYTIDSMKENIQLGYLDTLKSFKKFIGKMYYLEKEDDTDVNFFIFKRNFGTKYSTTLDDLVRALTGNATMNSDEIKEKAVKLIEFTAFKNSENPYSAMLENLAKILEISKVKRYTHEKLVDKIIRTANDDIKKNAAALQDREYVNILINNPPEGSSMTKNIFMQYFLLLISSDPEQYSKLKIIFDNLPVDARIGLLTLIYILY